MAYRIYHFGLGMWIQLDKKDPLKSVFLLKDDKDRATIFDSPKEATDAYAAYTTALLATYQEMADKKNEKTKGKKVWLHKTPRYAQMEVQKVVRRLSGDQKKEILYALKSKPSSSWATKNPMMSGTYYSHIENKSIPDYLLDTIFEQFGHIHTPYTPFDFFDSWTHQALRTECINIEPVMAAEDLVAPKRVWYVYMDKGWMQHNSYTNTPTIVPNFTAASAFYDRQHLEHALKNTPPTKYVIVEGSIQLSGLDFNQCPNHPLSEEPSISKLHAHLEAHQITEQLSHDHKPSKDSQDLDAEPSTDLKPEPSVKAPKSRRI